MLAELAVVSITYGLSKFLMGNVSDRSNPPISLVVPLNPVEAMAICRTILRDLL